MLKLLKYLKPYILPLVLLVMLVIVQVMTNLQLPDYMARIVNEGIVKEDNKFIIHTGLLMLLVSLISAACMVSVGFLASRIATGFSMKIRERLFSKVESFSLAEFNKFSTASLITRTTNDVQQIQIVMVMILRMVLSAPLMGIGAIFKAYHKAPSMSWIIVVAVVVMFQIIVTLFAVALPKFKVLQKLVDKLNLVTRQGLTGIRVIRAFNTEKLEEAKFEKANVNLTNANLFVNRLMVVMQPMMMMIFNITSIAIIWVGAHMINSGNLMIGDMIAFMQYAMQVIMSFLMISIIFIMIPRASVSATRIEEVLETEPQITDPEKPKNAKNIISGKIEFKNVAFKYPGATEAVLQDITFTANPGETTAFIGSTGSGKSTLINLIPRFYDVTEGEILIDGIDIRDIKLTDLYSKIGYVPQKAVLFSGTVESNIKYGAPNASQNQVIDFSKIAQASEFIEKMPDKYNTPISQGGINVSGGQKQRLSIARAMILNPEIYIFDDSFSALDFKTDAALRQALENETQDKTVLIVGQRISTIMNADKIIVIDEGRIVGIGTHLELLENCRVYKEIAYSQLSEKELKDHDKQIEKTESVVLKKERRNK